MGEPHLTLREDVSLSCGEEELLDPTISLPGHSQGIPNNRRSTTGLFPDLGELVPFANSCSFLNLGPISTEVINQRSAGLSMCSLRMSFVHSGWCIFFYTVFLYPFMNRQYVYIVQRQNHSRKISSEILSWAVFAFPSPSWDSNQLN